LQVQVRRRYWFTPSDNHGSMYLSESQVHFAVARLRPANLYPITTFDSLVGYIFMQLHKPNLARKPLHRTRSRPLRSGSRSRARSIRRIQGSSKSSTMDGECSDETIPLTRNGLFIDVAQRIRCFSGNATFLWAVQKGVAVISSRQLSNAHLEKHQAHPSGDWPTIFCVPELEASLQFWDEEGFDECIAAAKNLLEKHDLQANLRMRTLLLLAAATLDWDLAEECRLNFSRRVGQGAGRRGARDKRSRRSL
ncbi:hypothetical protein KCU73_g8, partial [Aureobasidium melanogenum]